MTVFEEFKKFEEFKSYYNNDDPSHDWLHIIRVVKACDKLSKNLNANGKTLTAAAVLHDVVQVPKNSKDRANASQLAANKAKELLKSFDYTAEELDSISQIIIEHSFSAGHKPSSVESQILQDADTLDGMGAIGALRLATTGAKLSSTYYHSEDPFAESRDLNDKLYAIDHFEAKLLKLYGRLNTEAGKSEGQKRHEFMKIFLNQLRSEIL